MVSIFWNDFFTFILPTILLFFLVALVSFPSSSLIFSKNQDQGFLNGLIIGLLGIGWVSFTIATISSLLNVKILIHSSLLNIFISFAIWTYLNHIINKRFGPFTPNKNLKYFLIYICAILFFYLSNSLNNIYGVKGAENIMNLGILNSLSVSNKIPANDFWFSGYSLNYYYFSHYVIFLISKILNLQINESFIYLTCIYPSLFITVFLNTVLSIVKKYTSKLSIGETTKIYLFTFIFTIFVNPIYSVKSIFDYFFNNFSLNEILENYMEYTIRVIPHTITENFNYGLFLNPLHALSNSLIVGVLIINLLIEIFEDKQKFNLKNIKFVYLYIFFSFSIIMNTWDFIYYFLFYILGFFIFRRNEVLSNLTIFFKRNILFFYIIILFISPWFYFISSPAGIPGIVKDVSNLFLLLSFWAVYLIFLATFLYLVKKYFEKKQLSTILYFAYFPLLIIILLEMFYFKDALVSTVYYRANTLYKFYNLNILFLTFSLSVLFGILLNLKEKKVKIVLLFLTAIVLITLPMNYFFILIKYSNIKYTGIRNQVDLVSIYNPNLKELIDYVNRNKVEGDVIWEGSKLFTGYNFNTLVSVYSGVPTVIGWYNHEVTWRFTTKYAVELDQRIKDTNKFFTDNDLENSKELLKKYNVRYIVISQSERDLFEEKLNEEKLLKLGEIVFEKGDARLIKIN